MIRIKIRIKDFNAQCQEPLETTLKETKENFRSVQFSWNINVENVLRRPEHRWEYNIKTDW
jgi:hypothetical protein